MESKEQLLTALQEIETWENEQKDLWFWEKLGRLPFMLLDKLTPTFIQEKMGQALDEMMSYVETGGQYLINEQDLLKRIGKEMNTEDLTLEQWNHVSLPAMDKVADDLRKSRANIATVQGATTGFGGIFTLAIDIPALLGLSLKVMQEISLAYGYDPRNKEERLFIIKCMQFTSSDIVGKKAILEELADYSNPDPAQRTQVFSQLQGWREVLMVQRENYGWKKLFQMIPIAGMIFGAYINKKSIEDTAEAAKMLYRKRRVLERLAGKS